MPQRRTAIKALRQNRTRHLHNLDIATDLKKTTKKFMALVKDKNTTEAQSMLKLLYKKLDKTAKRNLMHDNTVSRRKAKFSRLVNSLSRPA